MLSATAQALGYALSVVSGLVSARWLGPSGRGVLSMVTSGGYIAAVALSLGASTAITVLVARRAIGVWDAARASLMLTAGAGALSLGVCLMLSQWMGPQQTYPVMWLPFVIVANMTVQTQAAAATGAGRLSSYFASNVIGSLLQTAGYVVVATYLGASTDVALFVWVATQLVGGAVGWVVLLRSAVKRLTPLGPHLRSGLALSLSALPALLLGVANTRLDIVVLGYWTVASEVGRYSIAALGVSALGVIPAAIGHALTSRYAVRVDPERDLRRGMVRALAAAAIVGAGASYIAYLILPIVLGPQYRTAAAMFTAMVPGFALFSTCHVSSGYVNVVLGQPWLNGRIAGFALAVDMVLLAILARPLGGLGAAIASSVSYAAGAALNAYQLRASLFGHRSGHSSDAAVCSETDTAPLQDGGQYELRRSI